MRLKDKVAIITGGTSGIGLGVAKEFAKEGAKIAICGITIDDSIKAINEIKKETINADLLPFKVDVRNTKDFEKMLTGVMNKWGKIDIVVNNAGICFAKSILEMTDEEYINLLDVNTTGMFRLCRLASKYMIKTGGSIINTSSVVSLYGGAYQSAYATSKAAINGLTKSLARELGMYNIRVNAVAPGVVETDMLKANVNDEYKKQLEALTPLHRAGTPKDLAGAYVYLASDEASFTTGTIISVDGGMVL